MKGKSIYFIIGTLMTAIMLLSGCGNAANESADGNIGTEAETEVNVITKSEKASVQTMDDGKLKVTTESGEELEVALDSEDVEVVEEEDGSKVYKTQDGTKVTVSADGSTTVSRDVVEVVAVGQSQASAGSNGNSSSNTAENTSQNSSTDSSSKPEYGSNNDYDVNSGNWGGLGYDDSICHGAHTLEDEEVIVPSTCYSEGKMLKKCVDCGYETEYPIAKSGHDMEWITTRAATKAQEGERQLYCHTCGEILATETLSKLYDPGLEDATWTYDSSTQKHKTMYDGTVLTLNYYESEAGGGWGYFDKTAAQAMVVEINKMQQQVYGEGSGIVWDEEWYDYAKARALHYAIAGAPMYGGLYHMNSGGIPNVLDNRKYITFVNGYGGGTALGCFVIDSAGAADDFYYGEWWRSYFGTYYSSPT